MERGTGSPESAYVRQVKHLVEDHLTRAERASVRQWLVAEFDVQGFGWRPDPAERVALLGAAEQLEARA
jgi:hypothetical protein